MSSQLRRNMALFPISIVKQLTELSARQIRYYEEQGLITPARNKGKQRIFSLNDIERLLEIKDLIERGINIAGIKAYQELQQQEVNVTPQVIVGGNINKDLSDQEVHQWLKRELFRGQVGEKASLIQGDLSRFFQ